MSDHINAPRLKMENGLGTDSAIRLLECWIFYGWQAASFHALRFYPNLKALAKDTERFIANWKAREALFDKGDR